MLRSFRSAAAIAVAGAGARSSRRIPRSGLYLRQFASSSSSASRPSHLGLIGVGAVVGGLIASLGFDELTRSNEPVQMEPKATNPTTTTSPSTPTSTSTSSSPSKPTSPQTSTLAQSNHNEIKSTPSTEAHAPLGTPPSTAAPTAGDDFKSTPITRNPSPATTASSSSSDDDFDEEVEFAKWKKEQETGVSAEPNPYSGRPHVRNIVASEIPALIESRESDVLLQIYAPWCGACKMMAPIVDSIAEVMKTVDSETKTSNPLQVFVMDGEANVLPGFLTEEENRALPLIKFFPRCGSKNAATKEAAGCQSSVYPGRPNVEALIEFIHQAKEAAAKETSAPSTDSGVFPLPLAHSIGRSIEPKTHVAVESALVRRFEADSAEMPALKLHEIAPCGDELNLLMRRFMLSGYTSYLPPNEDEEEGKKLFTAYRACTDRESEKIEEFWLQVKKQTDEALEQIQTKKAMKAEEEKKAKEQLDAAKSNGAIITTSATEPATPKTETQ